MSDGKMSNGMTLRELLHFVLPRGAPAWTLAVRTRRCPAAEAEHRGSARQFMHVGHVAGRICHAAAAEHLPLEHRAGLLVHELGHLAAARRLGWSHPESSADREGTRLTGIPVEYRGRRRLEWSPVAFLEDRFRKPEHGGYRHAA